LNGRTGLLLATLAITIAILSLIFLIAITATAIVIYLIANKLDFSSKTVTAITRKYEY